MMINSETAERYSGNDTVSDDDDIYVGIYDAATFSDDEAIAEIYFESFAFSNGSAVLSFTDGELFNNGDNEGGAHIDDYAILGTWNGTFIPPGSNNPIASFTFLADGNCSLEFSGSENTGTGNGSYSVADGVLTLNMENATGSVNTDSYNYEITNNSSTLVIYNFLRSGVSTYYNVTFTKQQ